MKELSVDISGMSCNGCVRSVSGALKKIVGLQVKDVSVGKAVCVFDDVANKAAADDVVNAVVALGFSVTALNAKTP